MTSSLFVVTVKVMSSEFILYFGKVSSPLHAQGDVINRCVSTLGWKGFVGSVSS